MMQPLTVWPAALRLDQATPRACEIRHRVDPGDVPCNLPIPMGFDQ
jgi:hypothetical protein